MHTFSKISHASIKVIALNFIKPSSFPQDLCTLAKMNHVSLETNFINFDKLYEKGISFINSDKLYKA